jgi:hypothetical protein
MDLVRKHMLDVVGLVDGIDAAGGDGVHVRQGALDIRMDGWIDVKANFAPLRGIKALQCRFIERTTADVKEVFHRAGHKRIICVMFSL